MQTENITRHVVQVEKASDRVAIDDTGEVLSDAAHETALNITFRPDVMEPPRPSSPETGQNRVEGVVGSGESVDGGSQASGCRKRERLTVN